MELQEGASSGNTRDEVVDDKEMESSAENKNRQETENSLEDHAIMTLDKDAQDAEDGLEDYATIILDKKEQETENEVEDDANVIMHNGEQSIENRLVDGTILTLEKEQETENKSPDNTIVNPPVHGMKFNCLDALVEYYNNYAKQEGFGIMRRAVSFSADGKSKFVTVACSRVGKSYSSKRNILNPNPLKKTGCKARVNTTVFEDGSCRVNSVVLEHNHALFPSKSCFFSSDMKTNDGLHRMLETSNVKGINLRGSCQSVIDQSSVCEDVSYLEKDCRNYGQKSKQLQLEIGDAEAMYDFFVRMQAKNSNFFYVLDIDGRSHIRNVFWADARSRAAYEEFGDVVMFDTSYLVNKCGMPLSTFTGVNHHGQTILFGCGLLSDEAVETFVWLFKSLLSCMSGCAPKAIITDRAREITRAVEIVFPATRHTWGLWHILRTLPEKLGNYELYEPIKKVLLNVVYDSSTKKEFEDGWADVVKEFKELDDNEWLTNLYEGRNYWVPTFLKDAFWAGLLSTQRNHSMISFFDGNINPKTTLKQFLGQYNDILKSKVEKENQADLQSFNSWIPCATHFPIEKQFQQVYTFEKFKAFQQEVIAKLYCDVCLVREIDSFLEFNVSEIVAVGEENNQLHRTLNCKVYFNKEEHEINCSCCLFEFGGILCRHIVSVLIKIQSDITVPSKYVLSRWRKDLRRNHSRVNVCQEDWSGNPKAQRYYYLHKKFDDAANMAVTSDEACKTLWNFIDDYQQKLKMNDSGSGNNKSALMNVANLVRCENVCYSCGSSTVRGKGCPVTKRKIILIDQAGKKLTCIRANAHCKSNNAKEEKALQMEKGAEVDDGTEIEMLRSHMVVDLDAQET